MNLTAGKPDPMTAIKSSTFQRAAVKRVIDEETGERVGWMRPCFGSIEWSAYSFQGFEPTEAEALAKIEAAVIEHRGFEAADAAYVDEVMALPEPARTARRERDRAAVRVEIERQRNVIRPHDLELAQARLLIADAELADATAAIGRPRAA
jgi:hypothetical protein